MTSVPASRIRPINDHPLAPDRRYVLYWMTAFRRLSSNFALQHAVNAARDLGRPLVIFEALRADYPHASDRLHRFVIDGMAEHARALSELPVISCLLFAVNVMPRMSVLPLPDSLQTDLSLVCSSP